MDIARKVALVTGARVRESVRRSHGNSRAMARISRS